MFRSSHLTIPIFFALLLAVGCDGGTAPPPDGEVRGIVMVEGVGLSGVLVELSGGERREVTTDDSGRFSFVQVSPGAYVVTIRGYPNDASFGITSKAAVIAREAGRRTVTVDFVGNFIRTASISGTVSSGARRLQNVAVRVEGPDTVVTTTDVDGHYNIAGLRSGSYWVEISGFSASVSFPLTRIEVTLGTGESATVDFDGEPEVTATVVITSIRRRLPSGELESVDPTDVRGRIEVAVSVDRGEDTPESVTLLIDDDVVGRQEFNAQGSPVSTAAVGEVSALHSDPASSSFELIFTVATDEFDPETGQVRFTNGPRSLRARLSTREGGEAVWTATMAVTLTNRDTFLGRLQPQRGPVAGTDGLEWIGGDLGVLVIPVLFNPEREVTSLTVELRRSGGATLRERAAGGSAPFQVVFPGSGTPGATNVAEYQTAVGETDDLRVSSARYGDGSSLPGLPAVLASGLRIDNVPPPGGTFALPQQGADHECCLGNWVGAGFAFGSAVVRQPDAGVGGGTVAVHVGGASLTNEELLALPVVQTGGEVPQSAGNGAYSGVAVIRDALSNRRVVRLQPSDGNPLSNTLGGVFGVDLAAPEVRFGSGSLVDRQVNPPSDSEWVVRAEDELSGFSSLPARTALRFLAPGVDGSAACPFPGTAACQPAPDGLIRGLPTSGEGYFAFRTRVLDRAGNASEGLEATVLRDLTAPIVESLEYPSTLLTGTIAGMSAPVSDNVDLHGGELFLRFGPSEGLGEAHVPFGVPDTLGGRFDGSPVGTATAAWEVLIVRALERADAGGATGTSPSGVLRSMTGLRALVLDAARNAGTLDRSASATGAGSAQSFSVEVRGTEEGVQSWRMSAAGTSVCAPSAGLPDGGDCTDTPDTVELQGTAAGQGGVFPPPFEVVHFYARVDGRVRWLGRAQQEELVSDTSGADGREWQWTLEWRPEADFPEGTHDLFVVGVDGGGNALQSRDLATVQVLRAG